MARIATLLSLASFSAACSHAPKAEPFEVPVFGVDRALRRIYRGTVYRPVETVYFEDPSIEGYLCIHQDKWREMRTRFALTP